MRAYSSCTEDTRVVYTGMRVTEPMYPVHSPTCQARERHTRKSGLVQHTREWQVLLFTLTCVAYRYCNCGYSTNTASKSFSCFIWRRCFWHQPHASVYTDQYLECLLILIYLLKQFLSFLQGSSI